MAMSPEKNDVNIRELFEYRKPVTLYGNKGKKMKVYMRVIGDSEVNKARVKALRNSRELRTNLKDETSDEYLAYVPDLSEADKERLVEITLLTKLRQISRGVVEDIEVPLPKELPSDATLEEQEEHQKEIDDYPKKREEIVKEEIAKRSDKERKELLKKSREELEKEYKQSLINELCENELSRTFYDYVVYYSLYKSDDYKERVFSSFEEFNSLPSEVKDLLLEEYRKLELGMDDLKK